jgi:cell division transport system permease protein
LRVLGFFLQEGWSSLRRNLAASLAAVTAMGAVLFVLLLLLLLSRNALVFADRLAERKGLSVFLETGIAPQRLEELRRHFSSFPEVKSLRFISRSDALRDIEADLGTERLEEVLGENPLPDAFMVMPTPSASSAASLERMAREMEAYPGVEDVLYGARWVKALDRSLALVRRTNAVTAGLGILAILLVLANTLRLLVLMRDEQLAVMKIIGATDAFLRAPFVAAGTILCLTAGLISVLLLYAGVVASHSFLPGLRFLPLAWVLLFLLGAALVGVLGSLFTVEVSIRNLERRGGSAGA